jgi:hypothetical protein
MYIYMHIYIYRYIYIYIYRLLIYIYTLKEAVPAALHASSRVMPSMNTGAGALLHKVVQGEGGHYASVFVLLY